MAWCWFSLGCLFVSGNAREESQEAVLEFLEHIVQQMFQVLLFVPGGGTAQTIAVYPVGTLLEVLGYRACLGIV